MANYDLTYEGSRVQGILDTGDELRDAGYIFRGEATPSTVPGTPTERVAYIGGPGTYTNFGSSITVGAGCICIFKYTGSAWSNQVIDTGLSDAINSEASARQLGDSTLQGGINTVSAAITAINNAIGNGCVYAGIATPSSTPASGKVFYFAFTAGTYTNFNNLEVPQGINILKNNGSTWLLDSFLGIDDAPTQGSANLVKSGGVLNSIIQNGPAFDLSAYNAQEGVLATYADLNAALTALNALPSDFKKGGMSMKFVLTSDNKYVQFRCMAQNFTTDVTQWQGVDDVPTAGSNNLIKSGGVFPTLNAVNKALLPIRGKVSIIGDSISTYDGTMPAGYVTYYPEPSRGVTSIYDMWWHMLLNATKSELEVNASYAGSCVTDLSSLEIPDFYQRASILGSPDTIFVALGTNDSSSNVPFGDYDYDADISQLSETDFIPAYIKGIKELQSNYPLAKIVLFIFYMGGSYKTAIKNIGKHYGLPVIDVQSYFTNNVHPSKLGMTQVAQDVFSFFLSRDSDGKIDELSSSVANATALMDIPFKCINSFIIASNRQYIGVGTSALIPAIPLKKYKVTASSQASFISVLKNDNISFGEVAPFSDVYNDRIVISANTSFEFVCPEDGAFILIQGEVLGVDYTPENIGIYDYAGKATDRLNELHHIITSNDYRKQASSGWSAYIPVKIIQGHKYRFKNLCSDAECSVEVCDNSKQRQEILFGGVVAGMECWKIASYNSSYIRIYYSAADNYDFELQDLSAELDVIDAALSDTTVARIDNSREYSEVSGYIATDGKYKTNTYFKSRLYPVKGGCTYTLTPTNTPPSEIFAFLKNSALTNNQIPDYAGHWNNRGTSNVEISIKAPDDASYLIVVSEYNGGSLLPIIREIQGDSIIRSSYLKEGYDVSGTIEFLDAGLNGEELVSVVIPAHGQTTPTKDKTVNTSKDIFVCKEKVLHYNVSEGYKIAFVPYNPDYSTANNNQLVNNTWYTGEGYLIIPFAYFRVYVKSTTDNVIITPQSGYTVQLYNVETTYKKGKEYFLIAAQDSEQMYKDAADFIAGDDARPALQIATDEAYVHGTVLKVAPGNYDIKSLLNGRKCCLSFSHTISSHQYINQFQGRTIEGIRKPCGYTGDAAKINLHESLYETITERIAFIQTDEYYMQDWVTYFLTDFLCLKNLIINIPNNQKPICAIDLSKTEGGSRLEGLRIVGIPDVQEIFPSHAVEGSVGISSSPSATFNTNSYWNDIEVHGFHIGVIFRGMEHAFVHNLTVDWNEYGMKFIGGNQHPIVLIAVQDEHNVNLPDFGNQGGAITLLGYNASWPEAAPGFPDATTEGWDDRKRAVGNPIGRIEFTNNITPTGEIVSSVPYPTFFENGHGKDCSVRNMKHKLAGSTTYRNSIAPNYMQQFYDETLGKLVICIDPENKTWVDTQGNIVS